MHICEVCNKSFTRKDYLSCHLSVHGEKSFQWSHCSKCYSQQVKLKVDILRQHTNEKQKLSNTLLSCGYWSKILGPSFNFRRHMAVCKKNRLSQPHLIWKKWCLKWLMLRGSNLEVGEAVPTLLNSNEKRSLWQTNTRKLWNCTEYHKSGMYQHTSMPHWNRGKRKYWHSFDSLPIGRLFGLLAKREVKEDFPYYSNRHVIATDIATSTKDIDYFLSKFPLECIDIFLFNNPCSTTETVTYDMLEGIKDGHKVSAKYDSRGLFFETPITVMVFSNEFPMLEALKKDQWRIYEIIGEDLYSKTLVGY